MAKKGSTVANAYVNLIPSAEGFSSGVEKAISEGTEAGSKKASLGLSNLASGFAMGIGQAAFQAVESLGSKVFELGQTAIGSYKDYEQLIGGTETLFGTAAKYVEDYANTAYKSAGLSTNEYLETVNGMAAALNQSTGSIWESAKLGNQAVIDMSDNANKMGTTMELIQNAYNGFSKQNYTMLDNLKLGYGGTKQEMQRLLDDATKLSGIKYDINSYADIVNAIHVIQEEMGIAGTTQLEATETIEGSLNMVKSAWDNLIAGLGKDDANLDTLIDRLLNSLFGTDKDKGFLDNLLPRVETIVSGLNEFAIKLTSRLPGVFAELLPQLSSLLLNMVTNSINSLNENLPEMITSFETIFENIISTALTLVSSVIQMLPSILEMAISIIVSIANVLAENIPTLVPTIIEIVETIIDVILDNLDEIIDAATSIIVALCDGLVGNIDILVLAMSKITYELVAHLLIIIPQVIGAAVEIIIALVTSLVSTFMSMISGDYWNEMLNSLIHSFTDIDWDGIGFNIIDGIVQGFKNGWTNLENTALNMVSSIKDVFTNGFDIHSPSRVFENYGEMIDEGLAIGISSGVSIDASEDLAEDVTSSFDPSVQGVGGGDFIFPIYIGDEPIQTVVIKAMDLANYRSGGR